MRILKAITIILSTFFYIGYFPFFSGTFASIFGVLLFYFLRNSIFLHLLFILLLVVIGFLVAAQAERIFNKKDPGCVVIDEVAGMLLALVFLPYNIDIVVTAFVLFRILDGIKPYPLDKIQNLGRGIGIMGDDIVAGLYTNIILQVALRMASFKTS
jgi:phosphatidylglycerophosphatase A